MMKGVGFLFLLIVVFYSCKGREVPVCEGMIDNQRVNVSLQKKTDSAYVLLLYVDDKLHSSWPLDYPVYRYDSGDITGNGKPDIAVGVIKPTRFDPKPDKRLFIFRITDDFYIRPLWLGSRVSQPLEDFCIRRDEIRHMVCTIEREQSGNYLVAEYRWRGFGLDFERYIEREIPLKKAKKLLQDNE
ncbi:hypothetical protein M2459_001751 [Parabacteroides sp. PF5-5]|uniref:nuclear receptor-binding factor 2 n=1 Tax=unclassified Parabacteroides TaxID=2649774 RepID=UPI002476EED9|nr:MULTISPECIES: nuclear receptor-binding factor 2 [unclassified Parabacteroides]MDH6305014.1 hypothetical protein [Parabacteroides sp. PH5-39]MDH6315901.1 hypothetical protein [Parabacteroides sp. PF5-13]MDH6319558.1 hypothetical protein [Parabacteroides sp. PH5-13]MDH6323289.1 hypothetical protein [Parabacteroides sp. PH5-8]MDH6327203.1 hypothetical protein [Parabacteroides sp. PH5-41]